MQNPFRWDDLQVLLAVMRERTLSGAGERLSISASTVGRRLDGFEEALGTRLFDRTPEGALPTRAAEELFPLAEAMERSAAEVTRLVEGYETEPEGRVRITAPPGIASMVLAPLCAELLERHPRLRVELDAAIGYADLTRREADLALRAVRPRAGDLLATRIASSPAVILAGERYAAEVGPVRDLDALRWVSWTPELAAIPDARWVAEQVDPGRVVLRTGSFEALVRAAESGVGVLLGAELHTRITSLRAVPLAPELTSRLAPMPVGELWLVGHRALRHVPRVDAVWQFLSDRLRALAGGARAARD